MRKHLACRTSYTPSPHLLRRVSHSPRLRQQQAQTQDGSPHIEKPNKHTVLNTWYTNGHSRAGRRVNLFKKDYLGMDSLGRPAEALILRGEEQEREPGLYVRNLKKFTSEEAPLSASDLLEKIEAEKGIVGAQRVAENLEEVRSSWTSSLERKGKPTEAEYRVLAQRVRDGFTARQLADYYGQDEMDLTTDPDNLYAVYSNNLYTRSVWSPGTTDFPGNAAARLGSIKKFAEQQGKTAGGHENPDLPQMPKDPIKSQLESKSILTGRILRLRWRIQTIEDEEALGRIDIWPRREHLRVLLNHNLDILQRTSQRYGAKIDASMDHSTIRISADRGTGGDVLKFIVYMLERIRHQEIDIPPEIRPKGKNVKLVSAREKLRNSTFLEQLQRITNTVIEPAPGSADLSTLSKLTVYFLGPSADDFEDTKRLLLQAVLGPNLHRAATFFGASYNNTLIAPIPIEVGNSLPLVERSRQWCRWTRAVERKASSCEISKETQPAVNESTKDDKTKLKGALRSIERRHDPTKSPPVDVHLTPSQSVHWLPPLQRSMSVTIGRVLCPADTAKTVKVATKEHRGERLSSVFWRSLLHDHKFLSSCNGLQTSFGRYEDDESSHQETLLVTLCPKERAESHDTAQAMEGKPPGNKPKQLPDLEIFLGIDQAKRELTIKEIRAVFRVTKSDLMLPQQPIDYRFVNEEFITASPEVDPRIVAFVEASNLDVWGSERLKTPSSLVLNIPTYNGKGQDQHTKPETVEYIFMALEHRTRLSKVQDGLEYRYTVIEAGRIGGRREELRVQIPSELDGKRKIPRPIHSLFEKARNWIADMVVGATEVQKTERKRRKLDGVRKARADPRLGPLLRDDESVDRDLEDDKFVRRVGARNAEER